MQALENLKTKLCLLEAEGSLGLDDVVSKLTNDKEVDWNALRVMEKRNENGECRKNWKRKMIQAIATPGRFAHGGPRVPLKFKGAKQNAIASYVQERVQEADPTMCVADVADLCISSVAQRWHTTTPQLTVVMHRMVRKIFYNARSVKDGINDVIAESFECMEIVETTSPVNTAPSIAGVPLNEFKSLEQGVLQEIVGLKKAELETQNKEAESSARRAEAEARQKEADSAARQTEAEANSAARQKEAESSARQKEAECNVRIAEQTLRPHHCLVRGRNCKFENDTGQWPVCGRRSWTPKSNA